jgi:hypothetical protein
MGRAERGRARDRRTPWRGIAFALALIAASVVTFAVPALASAQTSYTLNVLIAGTGTGSVSNNGYLECPTYCSVTYSPGQEVEINASAGDSSEFAGWSGAGCSGTATCDIIMNSDETVTATFNVIPPTPTEALDVKLAGTGTGSVSDSTNDISCPTECSANLDQGSTVELTASADSGSRFTGWSGAGCSGTNSCIINDLAAPETVTATFRSLRAPPPKKKLTIDLIGKGSGLVTAADTKLHCPKLCTTHPIYDQIVHLVATAKRGSRFVGWAGSGCSDRRTCTVEMSRGRTITARFTPVRHRHHHKHSSRQAIRSDAQWAASPADRQQRR